VKIERRRVADHYKVNPAVAKKMADAPDELVEMSDLAEGVVDHRRSADGALQQFTAGFGHLRAPTPTNSISTPFSLRAFIKPAQ